MLQQVRKSREKSTISHEHDSMSKILKNAIARANQREIRNTL
jgi:hypothetical protein